MLGGDRKLYVASPDEVPCPRSMFSASRSWNFVFEHCVCCGVSANPGSSRMRSKNRKLVVTGILLTMCCAALAACAPGGDLKPLPDVKSSPYALGPGDKIRIITFGGEQLSGEFRVSDSGNIALPLLGSVHAAGQTPDALQANISGELKAKHLFENPAISVEVTQYRPFFILGEVTKPGEYPYEPGMTVLSAVSTAGGFTYRAVDDVASVVRTTDGGAVEGTVSRQSLVQPGDVITIFERHF